MRGQKSPWVMFSNRREKQFASHRTKAEEHLAEMFLHLMGLFIGNFFNALLHAPCAMRFSHSPINRATIIFITSVVPAAMDPMRTSRASRQIWYSSMYP